MNHPLTHVIPEQPLCPPEIKFTVADEDRANRERNLRLGDICDALRGKALSEFIDDSWELADRTFAILNDDEDDKIGRLNDLYWKATMDFAEWLDADRNGMYQKQALVKLGL